MELIDKYRREDDLEHSTAHFHRELMADPAELVDDLGEQDMMATWLIELLKHAEQIESDKAFFDAAKLFAQDGGFHPAFYVLHAAHKLRVTMSQYMAKRARTLAER